MDVQRPVHLLRAISTMHMPEDVQHRLHALHRPQELGISRVVVGAGCHIENAEERSMRDEDVGVVGDGCIETAAVSGRGDTERCSGEGGGPANAISSDRQLPRTR